ncbi:replication endonuclease, partial [Escherichia albertii]|nr:replication endonuclease [Escherichia albertii]
APLGNLINKSLDAQEKQDKAITLAREARKQARGAVDEAMASLRLLPSYLRDPLIRHLSFLHKKQESGHQKGKKNQQAERYASGTLRKIFERLARTDRRWLTPGYRSLAGRERLDDLLYLPQLNKHQIQTLAVMTAAMFSSTFEKLCDGCGATDGELTMDITLKAYQMLARMALHLHTVP